MHARVTVRPRLHTLRTLYAWVLCARVVRGGVWGARCACCTCAQCAGGHDGGVRVVRGAHDMRGVHAASAVRAMCAVRARPSFKQYVRCVRYTRVACMACGRVPLRVRAHAPFLTTRQDRGRHGWQRHGNRRDQREDEDPVANHPEAPPRAGGTNTF